MPYHIIALSQQNYITSHTAWLFALLINNKTYLICYVEIICILKHHSNYTKKKNIFASNRNVESNICFSQFIVSPVYYFIKSSYLYAKSNDMSILYIFSLSNNNATSTCITRRLNASSTTNITKSDGQFDVDYRDIATG